MRHSAASSFCLSRNFVPCLTTSSPNAARLWRVEAAAPCQSIRWSCFSLAEGRRCWGLFLGWKRKVDGGR
ncbi:hypothetical protein XA68_17777 [Ophiocordyceps unilateralis]|uniref:Uncharacterized protein n=1 Tax=Ophiocordyceps unilateralis TaxID=268505 RepID=A0A2A9PRW5_OPHUN|nr:hypothetical protein XA68_17777 [Ophiocordyceps unilateralis]